MRHKGGAPTHGVIRDDGPSPWTLMRVLLAEQRRSNDRGFERAWMYAYPIALESGKWYALVVETAPFEEPLRADDGTIQARKFPREGAGMLTSLTETAGLVELGEKTTKVEPGMLVGFLPHATLIN